MTQPIIDPATLTKEQREAIRKAYNNAKRTEIVSCGYPHLHKRTPWLTSPYLRGRFRMLQDIFGKNFFEK